MEKQPKYSAPVPFIGIYIAAASLVCFFLILSDVIHGFRRRKRWFPCRFFSLNSVTLTLLSIAAKLPIDLTTEMPSAQDQLSKLTGTAFVCVCMGFMLPSIGGNKDSECFTNLVALSIFVVTVMVNICIQMGTGLISSFIPEHIIMMNFMLVMIFAMWLAKMQINTYKEIHMRNKRDILRKHNGIMFQQLKQCYMHSNGTNPQFALSKCTDRYVEPISLVCLVVVLQATLRSHVDVSHVFGYNGLSDYGWSIRIIIVTQILTILLASLATAFRLVAVYNLEGNLPMDEEYGLLVDIIFHYPYMKASVVDYVSFIVTFLMNLVVVINSLLIEIIFDYVCIPCFRFMARHTEMRELFVVVVGCVCIPCFRFMAGHTEIEDKDDNIPELEEWTISKCKEMRHINELLSRRCPLQRSAEWLKDYATCLNLVYLAKVASVLTPSAHLTESLSEVFHLICFVDTKMSSLDSENKKLHQKLVKAMWLGKDFKMKTNEPLSDLGRALNFCKGLKGELFTPKIWEKLSCIAESINGSGCNTLEELCGSMEQTFVDILHVFLSALPYAIFRLLDECPVEEYEDSARLALKFLCQVQSLEGKVKWSVPDGSGYSGIIPSQAPDRSSNVTSISSSSQIRGESSHRAVVEDEPQMACNVQCEEIIQVE